MIPMGFFVGSRGLRGVSWVLMGVSGDPWSFRGHLEISETFQGVLKAFQCFSGDL